MKSQPNRNYKSDDVVMTPRPLAKAIIDRFKPTGLILEPCKGDGAFSDQMTCDWCEIKEGVDYLTTHFGVKHDWIVTNPPWSQIRPFLKKAMEDADNIVFLVTVNHLWTKARLRLIEEHGFGIEEIALCDTPKEFPQSGFQLGAIKISRGYTGPIKLSRL